MFDRVADKHEHYLDLLSARQKLVASNIANAETPGYRTQDIDFQAEFAKLVKGRQADVLEPAGLETRNDGNDVSMEREARLLAENAVRFQLVGMMAKGQFRAIKNALTEGRGA
ncbi:MAG: flagellar biosynthesis protein FlgB [Acidobacteria bacterium]|nr:flagellar biosynthesis protein FlgB [Acidobacteriota bacterium]